MRPSARAAADRRLGFGLLAPALVVLGTVTFFPVLWVLALSLERRVPVFGIADFVGLRNYAFLLHDPAFRSSVRVTAVFTVTSVAAEVVLGVAAALALARLERFRGPALALLLLPWCLPGVVAARTFEWLYHPTAGLASRLVGRDVNWLGDPALALPSVIAADVWRAMPFVALLAYARLQTIPPAVWEAAAVDGASGLRAFRLITLPLLAPVLLIAALFRTLDAVRAFDVVFVLTGGGPAGTTETLTVQAYRSLFQTLQLGYGAAGGVVVFALVLLTTWAYQVAGRRTEDTR